MANLRAVGCWAATAGIVLLASCLTAANGQAYRPANMLEAVDGAIYLTKFKAAAIAAGFEDSLGSPDFNGTIFAPVDLGFDQFLAQQNATLEGLEADSKDVLTKVLEFHIVPGSMYYPLATMPDGTKLNTEAGPPLIVSTKVPGVVHIYGSDPNVDYLNFGTVLQYQQIKGGKAILYVIDKVLVPPKQV